MLFLLQFDFNIAFKGIQIKHTQDIFSMYQIIQQNVIESCEYKFTVKLLWNLLIKNTQLKRAF